MSVTVTYISPTVTIGSAIATLIGGPPVQDVIFTGAQNGALVEDVATVSLGAASSITLSGVSTIIGSSGTDVVTLSGGSNTINVSGVETLSDTSTDVVTLSGTSNSIAVTGTGSLIGGAGNDSVTLESAWTSGSINLGGGTNSLKLTTQSTLTVAGVQTLTGDGKDVVTLAAGTASQGTSGAASPVNTITVTGVATLTGDGADVVRMGAAGSLTVSKVTSFVGATGTNVLTLADTTADSIMVGGVQTIIGLNGVDAVTLGAASTVTVSGIASLTGTTGNDSVTLGSAWTAGTIDLGTGTNTLNLSTFASTLTIKDVQSLVDTSLDVVTLGGTAANTITVTGTGSLVGGAASENVTLASAWSGGTLDLGSSGANSLKLGTLSTLTVKDVQTLVGDGKDLVTLAGASTAADTITVSNIASLTGSAGTDTVKFGAAGSLTVSAVETVIGGAGVDALTLANGSNTVTVSGVATVTGGKTDSVTLGAPLGTATATTITVDGVGTVTGNSGGNDNITIGAAQTAGTVNLSGTKNTLTLAAASTLSVQGVQVLTGDGKDVITLTGSSNSITVGNIASLNDSATDTVTLAGSGVTLTVNGMGSLTGGTGNDSVTLGSAWTAGTIDLGGGTNTLNLSTFASTLTIKDVQSLVDTGLDVVTLGGSTSNTITVTGTGSLVGGAGSENVTLASAWSGGTLDLGSSGANSLKLGTLSTLTVKDVQTLVGDGKDLVTLAGASTAADTITVSNIASLTGSAGTDTVKFGAAGSLTVNAVETVIGGTGVDALTLANGSNTVTVSGVATVTGGKTDSITLGAPLGTATATTITVDGVGSLAGGGNDIVTIGAAQTAGTVNLSGSANTLTVAAASTLSVHGVQVLTGDGKDVIAVTGSSNSITVGNIASLNDSATDTVTLANSANTLTVSGMGSLTGGTGNDSVTLGSAWTASTLVPGGGTIDLGGGTNTLNLSTFADTLTIKDVQSLVDTSLDVVTLGGTAANTITVTGTGSLVGGSASENVTLASAWSGGTLDLGSSGANSLKLGTLSTLTVKDVQTLVDTSLDVVTLGGTAASTITVTGTGSLVGGSASENVTLASAWSGGTLDLGSSGANSLKLTTLSTLTVKDVQTLVGDGKDVVTLAGASGLTDTITVSNIASLTGSAGTDTVKLGAAGSLIVSGVESVYGSASGTDSFTLAGGTPVTVYGGGGQNFVTANAVSGNEIALDQTPSSGSLTTAYSLAAGDLIGLGASAFNITSATVSITGCANATAVAAATTNFAYEEDNGFLYYSATGSFVGSSAVHVATLDSGSASTKTPWTYTAADFVVNGTVTPTSTATLTTLVNFNDSNGCTPFAGLAADAAGNLFGTTDFGGACSTTDFSGATPDGTVFEIAKTAGGYANAPTTLASFNGTNGGLLDSGLIVDAAGNLFAGSVDGGTNGAGTVFEIAKTAGGYTDPTTLVNFSFADTNGSAPSGLFEDAAGDLFGTTAAGGSGTTPPSGYGAVFEIAKTPGGYASTPTTLADFNGTNGAEPYGTLISDAAGDLFGTTPGGGSNGTVFEIAKTSGGYASTLTTLVSFNGADGAYPLAGLIADAAGNLFGTTCLGGANGDGTVFEIAKTSGGYASTPTTLVSFNGTNGAGPQAGLIADAAGDLFGATTYGGATSDGTTFDSGDGTVFEIAKTSTGYANTATTLISFNGSNGAAVNGTLISDAAGDLFGTTTFGGAYTFGTVFELTNTGFVTSTTPATSAPSPSAVITNAVGAGVLVAGTLAAPKTLEIAGGGTAALNAADTYATVQLDGATNLSLGQMGFISAVGDVSGNTITAAAANQTLGGLAGGDTLVGYAGFGDTFRGRRRDSTATSSRASAAATLST
jgi:hypothetical protein